MAEPAGGWLGAADADAEGRTRWVDASDPAAVDAWGSGTPASAPVLTLNPKFDPRCAYLAAAAAGAGAGAPPDSEPPYPDRVHPEGGLAEAAAPPATDAPGGGAAAGACGGAAAPGGNAGALELIEGRALSLELLAAARVRQQFPKPSAEAAGVLGAGPGASAAPAGEAAGSTQGSPRGLGEGSEEAGSAGSAGRPAEGMQHAAGALGAEGPAGAADMESAGAPCNASFLCCLPACKSAPSGLMACGSGACMLARLCWLWSVAVQSACRKAALGS